MTESLSFHGGRRGVVGPGERAYVFDEGLVESTGGRVFVGSGGRCVASGDAFVSLVDDGWCGLGPRRGEPTASIRDGRLFAETGVAYLAGAAGYQATGTARVLATSSVGGQVQDGRLVERTAIDEDEFAAARDQLLAWRPVPLDRIEISPEPGADAEEWLAPLREALISGGAAPAGIEERGAARVDVLEAKDPLAVVRSAAEDVAVPPTVRLVAREDGVDLVTDYGVGLAVRRSRGLRRWFV